MSHLEREGKGWWNSHEITSLQNRYFGDILILIKFRYLRSFKIIRGRPVSCWARLPELKPSVTTWALKWQKKHPSQLFFGGKHPNVMAVFSGFPKFLSTYVMTIISRLIGIWEYFFFKTGSCKLIMFDIARLECQGAVPTCTIYKHPLCPDPGWGRKIHRSRNFVARCCVHLSVGNRRPPNRSYQILIAHFFTFHSPFGGTLVSMMPESPLPSPIWLHLISPFLPWLLVASRKLFDLNSIIRW